MFQYIRRHGENVRISFGLGDGGVKIEKKNHQERRRNTKEPASAEESNWDVDSKSLQTQILVIMLPWLHVIQTLYDYQSTNKACRNTLI